MNFRFSNPQDLPQLKQLWTLAFHDEGPYLENFFHTYGTPDKILVATEKNSEDSQEKDEKILAMTAYFPSTLHRQNKTYRFAYLYAVATHPEHEKKGIASKLLSHVYDEMKSLNFHGVTTVPAQPSLHQFFARNGFEEYFLQQETNLPENPTQSPNQSLNQDPAKELFHPLTAEQYKILREQFFRTFHKNLPYISLDTSGFHYQKTASQLGQGDLYFLSHNPPPQDLKTLETFDFQSAALLTLERADKDIFWTKEYLSPPHFQTQSQTALRTHLQSLQIPDKNPAPLFHPATHEDTSPATLFGMIQWLSKVPENWLSLEEKAFLGLAFN